MTVSDNAINALREVALDIFRERQPADWDPDAGIDEPFTDEEYQALASAVLRQTPKMYFAVVIYGLDEEPILQILSEPGEPVGMSEIYEGHAFVKVCATHEEAMTFLIEWDADSEDEP